MINKRINMLLVCVSLSCCSLLCQNLNFLKGSIWTSCYQQEVTNLAIYNTTYFSNNYTSNDTIYYVYQKWGREFTTKQFKDKLYSHFSNNFNEVVIDWGLKKNDTLNFLFFNRHYQVDSIYNTQILGNTHRVQEGRIYRKDRSDFVRIKIIEHIGIIEYDQQSQPEFFLAYFNFVYIPSINIWVYPKDSYYINGNDKISFVTPNKCDLLASAKNLSQKDLKLWPNPVLDVVYLTFDNGQDKNVIIFVTI